VKAPKSPKKEKKKEEAEVRLGSALFFLSFNIPLLLSFRSLLLPLRKLPRTSLSLPNLLLRPRRKRSPSPLRRRRPPPLPLSSRLRKPRR